MEEEIHYWSNYRWYIDEKNVHKLNASLYRFSNEPNRDFSCTYAYRMRITSPTWCWLVVYVIRMSLQTGVRGGSLVGIWVGSIIRMKRVGGSSLIRFKLYGWLTIIVIDSWSRCVVRNNYKNHHHRCNTCRNYDDATPSSAGIRDRGGLWNKGEKGERWESFARVKG